MITVFDISTMHTFSLLYILHACYESFTMSKPHTSRQANSEKYIICKGFLGRGTYADVLRGCIERADFDALLDVQVSCAFVKQVETYNAHFITRQIANISKTIACINMAHSLSFVNSCTDHQKIKSDGWHRHFMGSP